jgi:hypothetical protein
MGSRDPQFLGSIVDLMLLLKADPGAVLGLPVLEIVGHGVSSILMPGRQMPDRTMVPQSRNGLHP